MNIWPTNWFLSMTSGVLLVSSMTTLNADKPLLAWTDSKNGFTMFRNLFLVADVFCSNTKNLEDDAMNFFNAINNLLTLILSSADGLAWSVFWPNTVAPCPGNVAIGLILFSYSSSLSSWVSLDLTSSTFDKPPLLRPAGANHGSATASLNAITPGNTTLGGTQTGLFLSTSRILTHGW